MTATRPRHSSSEDEPPAKRQRHCPVRLLDLPHSVLLHIFDILAEPLTQEPWSRLNEYCHLWQAPGRTKPAPDIPAVSNGAFDGRHRECHLCVGAAPISRDLGANALAAAAPPLAALFRRAVTTVVMRTCGAECGGLAPGAVAPMFARFCRADSLVIEDAAGDVDDAVAGTPHSERAMPLALGRLMNGSIVSGLQRLVLRGVAVKVEDVKDAVRAFPNLSEFVLFNSVFTDDDLALAAWEFGPRLRKLRLKGASGPQWGGQLPIDFCRRPSAASSRSDAPPSIRAMANLQVLCLQKQPRLTSRTFSHLAAMPSLGSLSLDRTNFSDDDAKFLSHLTALERLSVAGCRKLTHKMLAALPPSLCALNLSGSKILRKSTPVGAFASAPPVISGRLVFLMAHKAMLDSWRQLSGCSSLQRICMHNCTDTDLHAAEAFASWSSIKVVHTCGSPVASAAFGTLLREKKGK